MQPPAAQDAPAPTPQIAAVATAPMDLCTTTEDGFLSGKLFGALREQLEWHGANMECGGMLRPGADGIRLVFAAPLLADERLLIMFGIDGDLAELVGGEHVTNITIIDEANNRFFNSGGQERCWSTIESVQPVVNHADHADEIVQVVGNVYCAGSLPSLSDNRSVALRNIHFSGRLLLDETSPD